MRVRHKALPQIDDLQSMGAQVMIYGELDHPGMRDFNPSIAWDGKKLKISVRRCNFAVERHGKWFFRDGSAYSKTDVLYGDVDPDTLQVKNLEKLDISQNSPKVVHLSGAEDVRLFRRGSEMYAVAFISDRLTRSLHNQTAAMAEFLVKDKKLEYVRTLEKPSKELVEKNWCPTDVKSAKFDYTYSPTQTWKNGKVQGEKYLGGVHGGTQLIKQKKGYVSVVHEKKLERFQGGSYDKYKYLHYVAYHNEYGIVERFSKPFTFGTHENIEFASGLVEYKDDYIISIGIRDCKYALVKVAKSKISKLSEVGI